MKFLKLWCKLEDKQNVSFRDGHQQSVVHESHSPLLSRGGLTLLSLRLWTTPRLSFNIATLPDQCQSVTLETHIIRVSD